MQIEDHSREKINIPPREPIIKTMGRFFLREGRLLSDALVDALLDPIILLKRILVPRTVDRAIRPGNGWYELFPDQPNGKAILLCHGFGSTPAVFNETAPLLADLGYYVRVIRLSGHGTTPGHLAQTTAVEWFASVVWHYKRIQDQYNNISFVGHSLGGTLGLLLSTIYPIKSNIAMASPIELDIPPARFVRQASILVKYWPRSRGKRKQLEREGLDTYRVSPLWAIAGIFETCNVLRKRADRLTVPVLYVRSPNDHKTLINQPDKFRKYFPDTPSTFRDAENSPHAMLQGPERELIQEWIIEWVDQHS